MGVVEARMSLQAMPTTSHNRLMDVTPEWNTEDPMQNSGSSSEGSQERFPNVPDPKACYRGPRPVAKIPQLAPNDAG